MQSKGRRRKSKKRSEKKSSCESRSLPDGSPSPRKLVQDLKSLVIQKKKEEKKSADWRRSVEELDSVASKRRFGFGVPYSQSTNRSRCRRTCVAELNVNTSGFSRNRVKERSFSFTLLADCKEKKISTARFYTKKTTISDLQSHRPSVQQGGEKSLRLSRTPLAEQDATGCSASPMDSH